MTGLTDLQQLLEHMRPVLDDSEWVFCSVQGNTSDYLHLKPSVIVSEPEGITLVLEKSTAARNGFDSATTFRRITLMVHSSLEAVGLTAAVSRRLTSAGISANVIAGFYHDHVFVPSDKADAAYRALQELGSEKGNLGPGPGDLSEQLSE